MASLYPGALDALVTTKSNSTLTVNDHPQHHNDMADAINKIEAELGIGPKGTAATVAARLATLEVLKPTAVKTSAYSAVAYDFVPVDTTSGNVTITLPTAPADKTKIGVKMVIQGGTNTVSVVAAGGYVYNKTGGGTSLSLTLLNQSITVQYKATGAIWYVISDDFALSTLDARYVSATADTLNTRTITQTAHGFVVGNAIRYDNATAVYVKSLADAAANSDVYGIVSSVISANSFVIQVAGHITGLAGLVAGNAYFLDPTTAGLLTLTEPSAAGQISKPMLMSDTTTSGYVINARGIEIPGPAQTRMVIKLKDDATALTVQEDVFAHVVTSDLNGLALTAVIFTETTAPATTIPSIGIRKNASTEILSTNVTIDLGELTSETAATPYVINVANSTVATGDVIHIDCDAAGAVGKGAEITLVFS